MGYLWKTQEEDVKSNLKNNFKNKVPIFCAVCCVYKYYEKSKEDINNQTDVIFRDYRYVCIWAYQAKFVVDKNH